MVELNMHEVEEVNGGLVMVGAYFLGVAVGGALVAGGYALASWLSE